jgi:outer membrane receptor protein involved in Fe transport
MLGDWFQNFQAGGNLTLAQSNVDIAADELELIRAFDPNAKDSRPLQGQSSYVVNLDLGYSNPLSGTTVSVFYNVFGERLSEVSAGGTPNLFEQPRHTLDLTFSQGLPMGFTLKGSAKNILNAEYREIHTFKDQEFEKQIYNLGRSFSLGISYGI